MISTADDGVYACLSGSGRLFEYRLEDECGTVYDEDGNDRGFYIIEVLDLNIPLQDTLCQHRPEPVSGPTSSKKESPKVAFL